MELTSKEWNAIIVSSLVLGIVFGFDTTQEVFKASVWLQQTIFLALASLVVLLFYTYVTKDAGRRQGTEVHMDIWSPHRYGFKRVSRTKKKFPGGVLIPLLITLLTNGKAYFAGVLSIKCKDTEASRFGKKYKHLTDRELAHINLIGPFALAMLGWIISSLYHTDHLLLQKIATIPFAVSFSLLIPLAGLNGSYGFFGKPAQYILTISFTVIIFFLSRWLSPLLSLVLGLIGATVLMGWYYHWTQIKA